jgi:hypothetical protein
MIFDNLECRVIKIAKSNQSKELSELLKSTYFDEKCKSDVRLFVDSSILLEGCQSILN